MFDFLQTLATRYSSGYSSSYGSGYGSYGSGYSNTYRSSPSDIEDIIESLSDEKIVPDGFNELYNTFLEVLD